MSLKIGDKVRFLNDVGGGIVVKIIDRFSVMVENEFGFDIPAAIKEVVLIERPDYYGDAKNEKPNESLIVKEENNEKEIDLSDIFYPEVFYDDKLGNLVNIKLAFVPKSQPGNSDLNVFLINDSNYNVLYSIINKNEQGDTYSNAVGVLEANTKEQTETIAMSSVNKVPEYIIQLIFYRKDSFKIIEPIVKSLKINPVRFYKEKAYAENEFFNEDAIIMPVYSDKSTSENELDISAKDLKKAILEKETTLLPTQGQSRKKVEDEIVEVDLHIHEILDDFRGLSNGEMLEIQMDHFRSALNEAILKRTKKIVFIHGVGNGVLKTEIRKELDRKKKVLDYQDASFKEYGYGATLVRIR